MEIDQRKKIVDELISLTVNGNAHVTFEDAVANLPADLRGKKPENLPYSIWQLVDHMRIAQKDIVDFSISDDYQELNWPDDYWSDPIENVDDETWEKSLEQIQQDRKRFFELLNDEKNDLTKPFPWGSGQTLMREALLIADHNAYHTAEIVVIRRLLKSWH